MMKRTIYICDLCGKEFIEFPSSFRNAWLQDSEIEGRTVRLNIKVHIYEKGKGDRSEIIDADLCADCLSRILNAYSKHLKGEHENGTKTKESGTVAGRKSGID